MFKATLDGVSNFFRAKTITANTIEAAAETVKTPKTTRQQDSATESLTFS